ncbi:MAG: hypothetical protein M1836_006499 [Candelina mexicana]|nr:MAG: hypothetical protein M1836_006499 [Candelina mexicana]
MLFRQPPWPPQAVSSTEATVWNEIEAITDDDILPYSVTESRRLIHVTNLLKKAAERFRQVEHYLSEYREVAATGFFQHYDEGDDLRRSAHTSKENTEVALDAALKLRRSRMEEAFANLKLYEFPNFVEPANASCSLGT